MHRRLNAHQGLVVGSAAFALWLIGPVAAQDRVLPKTPWGDPSVEGIWSSATVTPLQRPPQFAGKEFLSLEEVAHVEREDAAERVGPGTGVGSSNRFYWERSKVVKTRRSSLIVDPADGRVPPLTAEGQRRVEARRARAETHPVDGPEDRWLTERCILFGGTGPPMLPEPYNAHYLIMQTPSHVSILTEINHVVRVIYTDGRPHVSAQIAQWTGDSRGHWEGNTLVVDTTGFRFNEQSRFGLLLLDGLSDQNLRLVERFTRTDARTLIYRATIEDPTVYTRPWTVEEPMTATAVQLYEYACHEGNYGMANMLSGQRAEDRAAAASRNLQQ